MGDRRESPKVRIFLGARNCFVNKLYFGFNYLRNRRLDHLIEVAYRGTFLTDGDLANESTICAPRRAQAYPLAVPTVALRVEGTDVHFPIYEDITLGDFRHAVDFFVTDYNDTFDKYEKLTAGVRE